MSDSLDREIIKELLSRTNDKKFTREIAMRIKTEQEKKDLLSYFQSNPNTSINQINHKALEIVSERWGIIVPKE